MLKDNYDRELTHADREVFEKWVPPTHFLRRVQAVMDFEAFREQLRDAYSPDMGRPAVDPVMLLKLLFLELYYRLSDREVIAEAQVNAAFREFLDLSSDTPLPSPVLLSQFRTRVGKKLQAIFDEIVSQARAHGLVKDRLRLKDATHVVANVAVPSALALVAQLRRRLLDALRPYAPQEVAQEEAEAEAIHTLTADWKDAERLAYRVAHLEQIVAWADELVKKLGPTAEGDRQRQALERALALAHQLLEEQQDPDGKDRLCSAVDPDARRGKHGEYYVGYQLDILMDAESEIITAVEVLPGNGDEAADSEHLLRSEEAAHGNQVAELSTDGALSHRGEVVRTLEDPEGLGVVVYAPPRAQESEEFFSPAEFTLDEEGKVLTCPAGQQTEQRYPNSHGTGWRFYFRRSQCRECPLLPHCMARLPAKRGRTVVKNDYQAEYDRLRARAETERYREVRREHPKVERKLAEIVQRHGGRRARYRGRWRVKIQYLMLAIVVNIKRMVKLLWGKPTAATSPVWAGA